MSKENDRTLEAYQQTANLYLRNSDIHDQMDMAKAIKKQEKLESLILSSFSSLEKGAKIFEIGSGNGTNAEFMQNAGFNVTASDTAKDFIEATKSKCKNVIYFNALKDVFPEKYNGIFCWRVFVHFTVQDALEVIEKVYNSLEDGGIFIFNAINREAKAVNCEWVDFDNEYKMGVERFYNYFTESDLKEIISKTNFKIKKFYKEGGENGNKWLIFVLEK